jgi:hypothetical protein
MTRRRLSATYLVHRDRLEKGDHILYRKANTATSYRGLPSSSPHMVCFITEARAFHGRTDTGRISVRHIFGCELARSAEYSSHSTTAMSLSNWNE